MGYKRVMLKISGEVLGGPDGSGADAEPILALCKEVKKIVGKKVQVAIVVGGGNFWRYRDNKKLKIPRSVSDGIGMMATIMNAKLLTEALKSVGVKASPLAPYADAYFAIQYSPGKAKSVLEKGGVAVCGGGTGNPYFTTDSAAALRALELECDVVLKATKVDGIYDKDPVKNKKAKMFKTISYDEILKRELGVMDLDAILLCKQNGMPVRVFNMNKAGNLLKAATGSKIGSLITP
jgi:uridylate kinase